MKLGGRLRKVYRAIRPHFARLFQISSKALGRASSEIREEVRSLFARNGVHLLQRASRARGGGKLTMKKLLMLSFCMLSLQTLAALTTTKVGNQTYTSGFVDGKYVNTTTTQIGNQTYTSGRAGDTTINTTTTKIGNQTYTNGRVGNENLNTTSTTLGNQTYTNGRIGESGVHTTTTKVGTQTYTNGRVGEVSFSSTSQNVGNTTYTSGMHAKPMRNNAQQSRP